jgi:HSP20 family protein
MKTNAMTRQNGNTAGSLDNVFDNFFGSGLRRFFDGNYWDEDRPLGTSIVPVNVRENGNHYEMDVVAPGCRKEDFSVTVQGNQLTISFERKEEDSSRENGWVRNEFTQRSFQRSFTMDDSVDAGAIKAVYTDGILRLQIPKSEQAKLRNRRIEIQ